MRSLASGAPLGKLALSAPFFRSVEEVTESLWAFGVPVGRASWFCQIWVNGKRPPGIERGRGVLWCELITGVLSMSSLVSVRPWRRARAHRGVIGPGSDWQDSLCSSTSSPLPPPPSLGTLRYLGIACCALQHRPRAAGPPHAARRRNCG
jgi:hypothetical protein